MRVYVSDVATRVVVVHDDEVLTKDEIQNNKEVSQATLSESKA